MVSWVWLSCMASTFDFFFNKPKYELQHLTKYDWPFYFMIFFFFLQDTFHTFVHISVGFTDLEPP